MFTIKHETPWGDTLYEAETFECRPLGATLKAFSLATSGREPVLWLGRLMPPRVGSTSECRIFVMNRDGSTIANYRYEPTEEDAPDENAPVVGAAQADMSLAA